jgi:hypothetical protein
MVDLVESDGRFLRRRSVWRLLHANATNWLIMRYAFSLDIYALRAATQWRGI